MLATDLYKKMEEIYNEVQDATDKARESEDPATLYKTVLKNQNRIAGSMMILASVLQMVLDEEIALIVTESNEEGRN